MVDDNFHQSLNKYVDIVVRNLQEAKDWTTRRTACPLTDGAAMGHNWLIR